MSVFTNFRPAREWAQRADNACCLSDPVVRQVVSAEPALSALETAPFSRYTLGNVARVTVGAPVVIGLDVANVLPYAPRVAFRHVEKAACVYARASRRDRGQFWMSCADAKV